MCSYQYCVSKSTQLSSICPTWPAEGASELWIFCRGLRPSSLTVSCKPRGSLCRDRNKCRYCENSTSFMSHTTRRKEQCRQYHEECKQLRQMFLSCFQDCKYPRNLQESDTNQQGSAIKICRDWQAWLSTFEQSGYPPSLENQVGFSFTTPPMVGDFLTV